MNIDIEKLRQRLIEPLPGLEAHSLMMPEGRGVSKNFHELISAAVLIILIKHEGKWVIPLIKRSQDKYAHSGQIALPGGRLNSNESAIQAGIRETYEEIGLIIQPDNILGKLSLLPIPVSNHLVHPFIAIYQDIPEYHIDTKEVAKVFEIDMCHLQNKNAIKSMSMTFQSQMLNIPFYDIQGHTVWGATAMILSELVEIIKQL